MSLQEFLLSRFKSWKPTAPEVISRTKRDITMRWEQEEFAFLQDELLYRVETNHKLPKWIVVYSGGKTTKRIDDLAPSHPHRFRLKVILKSTAVQCLAEKAIDHYGDEKTALEKLGGNLIDTEDDNRRENTEVENGDGDNKTNMKVIVEETSEIKRNREFECKNAGDVTNIPENYFNKSVKKQKWLESQHSDETWTSTASAGTSAVCFCMAVQCGYLKQVQSMFDERPELLDIVNASHGFTPLATAVRKGDINTTKFLLGLGASIDQQSSAGQTPLQLAVLASHAPIAELLIERGADWKARDWIGRRVEHCAVDSCSLEMVRLVLDRGGDVTVTDNNGWTPLFRALCQESKTELVEELVARGSDINAVDNAGLPLTSAAKLLRNRHGRSRHSILQLVDSNYPHEKALANFTRLTKKIYNVNTLLKFT